LLTEFRAINPHVKQQYNEFTRKGDNLACDPIPYYCRSMHCGGHFRLDRSSIWEKVVPVPSTDVEAIWCPPQAVATSLGPGFLVLYALQTAHSMVQILIKNLVLDQFYFFRI
jgi:hypothetical protein